MPLQSFITKPYDNPSQAPSDSPSKIASSSPSDLPSKRPSEDPSEKPSHHPSLVPSLAPSKVPSEKPSIQPSLVPSSLPSKHPSEKPSKSPSFAPSRNPSFPATGEYFGNFEYYINPTEKTWSEHEAEAALWGGHLASITSLEEDNFINLLRDNLDVVTDSIWIGGEIAGESGKLFWSDSSISDYKGFDVGEPSNAGNCVLKSWQGTGPGLWADSKCSKRYYGVYKKVRLIIILLCSTPCFYEGPMKTFYYYCKQINTFHLLS